MGMTEVEINKIVKNTQIVLSFGSAGYGFELEKESWELISEHYKNDVYLAFDVDKAFVYFDAESLKGEPGTKIVNGKTLNDDWKQVYLAAMKEAKVMLFIITKAWLESVWCKEEWKWFCEMSGTIEQPKLAFLLEDKAHNFLSTAKIRTAEEANLINSLINTSNTQDFTMSEIFEGNKLNSMLMTLLRGKVIGEKKY